MCVSVGKLANFGNSGKTEKMVVFVCVVVDSLCPDAGREKATR